MFDKKMLEIAQNFQKRMAEVQEKLAAETVEFTAGGGVVKATMNGKMELVNIEIDPSLLGPDDVEMLEDLVVAAINGVSFKVKELVDERMSEITLGLPIPFDMFGKA